MSAQNVVRMPFERKREEEEEKNIYSPIKINTYIYLMRMQSHRNMKFRDKNEIVKKK